MMVGVVQILCLASCCTFAFATSPTASPTASPTVSPTVSPAVSPTVAASAASSPTPSTTPTKTPSPSSSPNPAHCTYSILKPVLVEESYMNHVELVRQGLPMELVKSFYEHALKDASLPECNCELYQDEVDMSCVYKAFIEDHGFVSKKLMSIVTADGVKSVPEKFFPSLVVREDLPILRELERKAIAEGLEETLAQLYDLGESTWPGVSLPSDELLRIDRDKTRACTEFNQKVDRNNLWLPATALTAYVVGIAEQILLLAASSITAESILADHIRMVHLASRCTRQTGDVLRVPAVYVEGFVTRAHLALKKSSTGPKSALVAGFPSIMSMPHLVHSSHRLFPEAIQQMSSLNSYGRTKVLSWNGTQVFMTDLSAVMLANATLQQYIDVFVNDPMVGSSSQCAAGFRKTTRLSSFVNETEQCCSHSCMQYTGGAIRVSVMNEMCCTACNELVCNVDDLAQVLDTQAYGFDRESGSAVANVW